MINLPAHTGGSVLGSLVVLLWEKQANKCAKSLQREGKTQASVGAPEGYINGSEGSIVDISFSPIVVDWALQIITSQKKENFINEI